MDPEQDQFSELRKLLAIKRHEQPPPGFYKTFSFQIIARIKAGETAAEASFVDRLFEAEWLRRIWSAFETQPAFAGATSFAVCGLLAAGLFYSDAFSTSGANVGTLPGMLQSYYAPPTRLNSPRPFLEELTSANTNGAVPAHLLDNPLVNYPDKVQTLKWQR